MPSHEEIRQEVGSWLDENWNPNLSLVEWRNILPDGGWAAPSWPEDAFGRGYTQDEAHVVSDVFLKKGAVGADQSAPHQPHLS